MKRQLLSLILLCCDMQLAYADVDATVVNDSNNVVYFAVLPDFQVLNSHLTNSQYKDYGDLWNALYTQKQQLRFQSIVSKGASSTVKIAKGSIIVKVTQNTVKFCEGQTGCCCKKPKVENAVHYCVITDTATLHLTEDGHCQCDANSGCTPQTGYLNPNPDNSAKSLALTFDEN